MVYKRLWLPVCALAVGMSAASLAQDDAEERDLDAVQCIRLVDLQDVDIVDDETLIFRTRRGTVYRNDLPHRCPGLRTNDTLMYRSSAGSLCNVDVVTVLYNRGFGFWPGASCGLGMFHPITAEIADELLRSGE